MYAIKVYFSVIGSRYYDADYFYNNVLRHINKKTVPYKMVPDSAIPDGAKIWTGKHYQYREPCRDVEPEELQAELFDMHAIPQLDDGDFFGELLIGEEEY